MGGPGPSYNSMELEQCAPRSISTQGPILTMVKATLHIFKAPQSYPPLPFAFLLQQTLLYKIQKS